MTAKAKNLCKPLAGVDEEDIRHMKRRILMFAATETISSLEDTLPCATCLSRWVQDGAAEHDVQALALPILPAQELSEARLAVRGMAELLAKTKLPQLQAQKVADEIASMGAVDTMELNLEERRCRHWSSEGFWPLYAPLSL